MRTQESVFFYTFHKCASSLFAGFVLPNALGLQHVDYAAQIFRGELADEIAFHREGVVYGPIRLSASPASRARSLLVDRCSIESFVRDRIAVFLVRDPRDILVSRYYWIGSTKSLRPERAIRLKQDERRREISSRSIDEYVIEAAPILAEQFAAAAKLLVACPRSALLRYDDMLNNWPAFEHSLLRYLVFSPEVLAEIERRVQPPETEDVTAHKRSSRTGGHRTKLKPETVELLNGLLGDALKTFGYAP